MLVRALYAIPLTLLFMSMSDHWGLDGLVVGYLFGFTILLLIGGIPVGIVWSRLPSQLFWLAVYVFRLAWEIIGSGFDVARRVLDPRLPVNLGELVVPIQDEKGRFVVSALSAHAISVTPGELVIGFKSIGGKHHMIVHTLDMNTSREHIEQIQAKRLKLLKRILGDAE